MGFNTGIQYGTAVINKVNKPLTTNLNENTWKLVKPNVISLFNPPTRPTQIMKVISRLVVEGVITFDTDKWRDFVERVISTKESDVSTGKIKERKKETNKLRQEKEQGWCLSSRNVERNKRLTPAVLLGDCTKQLFLYKPE